MTYKKQLSWESKRENLILKNQKCDKETHPPLPSVPKSSEKIN